VIQTAALGAAVLAAGCTGSGTADSRVTHSDSPAPSRDPDPDVVLLTAAIADEQSLLNYCADVVRRHRQLKPVVAPVLQRQREHVRRFRATLTDENPPRNTPAPPVPRSRQLALKNLRQFASSAEEARLTDCLAAKSGLLARMLASASAAHALTVESIRNS
jgi:hypothetical protein